MRKLKKYNLTNKEVSKSIFNKYKNDEFSDNVILKKIEFKEQIPTISSNINLQPLGSNTSLNQKEETATALTDIYEEIYLSEDENSESGSNKSKSNNEIVNFHKEDNKKDINGPSVYNQKIYSNSLNSSDEEIYQKEQNKFNDFIKNKRNYRENEPEISKFNFDYNDDLNKNFRSLKSNSISFANRTELENKNRNRSKSIFSTKSISKKPEDESDKRRNIIDIIRKFNGQDSNHPDQNLTNSHFLTSATEEFLESNNNHNEEYNDYYSDNKSSSNGKLVILF
jgi:hypothetical protein